MTFPDVTFLAIPLVTKFAARGNGSEGTWIISEFTSMDFNDFWSSECHATKLGDGLLIRTICLRTLLHYVILSAKHLLKHVQGKRRNNQPWIDSGQYAWERCAPLIPGKCFWKSKKNAAHIQAKDSQHPSRLHLLMDQYRLLENDMVMTETCWNVICCHCKHLSCIE